MITEEKPQSRSYKVTLLDRSTSPKINRCLRELTGKSVWEVSTIMNNVPSIILTEIPLHKAIEIKAQLGKLGLNSRIESMFEEASETILHKLPIKPDKPAIELPVSIPPASAEEISPAEHKLSPPLPPHVPQPPSRLTKRPRKKRSLIFLLLPFIILLIIIIIIIYLGEIRGGGSFFLGGKITSIEESGSKRAQMKFIPSKEDLAERLKKSREALIASSAETTPETSLAVQDSSLPVPEIPPELSTPESQESVPSTSPSATGMPLSISPASPQTGGQFKPTLASPASRQPSTSPTSATPGGAQPTVSVPKSVKGTSVPKEFIGGKEPAGVSPEKLHALANHAKNALNRGNLREADNDFSRLQMAEASLDDSPKETARRLESPEMQNLMYNLAKAAGKSGLQAPVEFEPEIIGAKINIHTNLPDDCLTKVELTLPGEEKPQEYNLPVEMETIEIPFDRGLPSGKILIKVILLPLAQQPEIVAEILGKNGENLKGELVKGKGKVEYQGSLNNNVARARGEITKEESEREFKLTASMNDLKQYKLSGFKEYIFEERLFVTISADGVDEAEFILKACRSAGMLTQEMDDPPPFLRLIINGGQYYIASFYCRQVLREYGENDIVALQFLLNQLFTL